MSVSNQVNHNRHHLRSYINNDKRRHRKTQMVIAKHACNAIYAFEQAPKHTLNRMTTTHIRTIRIMNSEKSPTNGDDDSIKCCVPCHCHAMASSECGGNSNDNIYGQNQTHKAYALNESHRTESQPTCSHNVCNGFAL